MKKRIIPVIMLGLLVSAPAAFAEEGVRDRKLPEDTRNAFEKVRDSFREELREKKLEIEKERDEIKREALERRDKVLEARSEFRMEGLQKSAERSIAMLTTVAEQLQNLIDRTASRIEKMKAQGGDTKASEANLTAAQADLAKARTQIDALKKIDLAVSSTTSTTTLKTNSNAFKDAVKGVKDTFKLVHRNLAKSISTLKSGRGEGKATTTPATTVPSTTTGA